MRKTTAGIVFLMILTLMCGAALAQTRVLATTFPVYQIVRNITQNVPDVEVQLMLPAQAGCPHDYALTPQDMSKLAQADILVLNGLGLEAFLGSPSARAQKELHTIDSSKGISGLLPYTDAEAAHEEHEGHHHGGMNPHLFASPRMAAQMTRSIAGQLADLDPANAATYWANAENYARTLDALADEFAALGGKLKNSRIITQHGVFDYLARDMGLDVVAEQLGYTASYLSRVFKKDTDVNVIDYIIEIRILISRKMLSEGDKKVYEVAEEVGYNNYNHFSKTFKRIAGITPSQFLEDVKK